MRETRQIVFWAAALVLFTASFAAKPLPVERDLTAARADWILMGEDPRYSKSVYIVGKGYSMRSAEEAKRKAVVEVEKQIGVMVKSVERKEKREFVNRDQSWQWDAQSHSSVLRTEGALAGVEIAAEAKLSDGWHALAVLHRGEFALRTADQVERLETEIVAAIRRSTTWLDQGDPAAALVELDGVRLKMEERDLLWKRLSAVDLARAKQLQRTTEAKLEAIGSKIAALVELKLVSGANQQTEPGGGLPEPLLFAVSMGGKPAARIPVALLSADGRTIVELRHSDEAGRLEWEVSKGVVAQSGVQQLRVGVRLQVDAAWRKLLMERDLQIPYRVEKVSLPLRIMFRGEGSLGKLVRSELAVLGIEERSTAAYRLELRQQKTVLGQVQGLRDETVSIELTTTADLFDRRGRNVASCTVVAKGFGSSEQAAARHAIGQSDWSCVISMVRAAQK